MSDKQNVCVNGVYNIRGCVSVGAQPLMLLCSMCFYIMANNIICPARMRKNMVNG